MVKDKIKAAVMIDVTQSLSITYKYDVTYIMIKGHVLEKGFLSLRIIIT